MGAVRPLAADTGGAAMLARNKMAMADALSNTLRFLPHADSQVAKGQPTCSPIWSLWADSLAKLQIARGYCVPTVSLRRALPRAVAEPRDLLLVRPDIACESGQLVG